MTETTKQILIAWQQAYNQVEENSSLMILSSCFTDLCAARMEVCSIADGMLYSLNINNTDYPEELIRHLKANSDKGCGSCWFSSVISKNHPECQKKITEWFESKEQLLMYIELILQ